MFLLFCLRDFWKPPKPADMDWMLMSPPHPKVHRLKPYPSVWWYLEVGLLEVNRSRRGHEGPRREIRELALSLSTMWWCWPSISQKKSSPRPAGAATLFLDLQPLSENIPQTGRKCCFIYISKDLYPELPTQWQKTIQIKMDKLFGRILHNRRCRND